MVEETLTRRVTDALNADAEVSWVKDFYPSGNDLAGTETYVFGYRNYGEPGRDGMLFVIALGDPSQRKDAESQRRLRDWKDTLTTLDESSTSGPWWGMASTVETALRVSRGEVQFEREEF